MGANKYKGHCSGCGYPVAAGEGVYAGGVWCEEPKRGYDFGFNDPTHACKRYHEWQDRKRAQADLEREAYLSSPEYAEKKAEADAAARVRAEKELALNAKGLKTCQRCGGAGGAEQWRATGWACFECEGRCVVPMSERELKKAKKNAINTA